MNGLLDFFGTPQGQGLLSAVAGGMAGARRGQPINSIGRGLLAGTAGYGNALDRQQQAEQMAMQQQDREQARAMRELQMGQIKTQLERDQAQQDWRKGLPDVYRQATEPTYGASDVGPTMAAPDPNALTRYAMLPNSPFADKILEQQIMPKPADYKVVGNALVKVGPGGVTEAYKAPEKVDYNALVIPDGQGGYKLNDLVVGAKRDIAAAGRPSVQVDARNFNTQESEQSKAYGKSLGEIRSTINQAGYDAPGKLAQLDRMETLLTNVGGGAAAPTIAQISSLANSFGIKLDPKLGEKEASEALAREMAASMRQPGTGPMTDKDFDNFLKRVPDLSKSPEGRAQIFKTMRGALERDVRAAQFAREYASKNGGVIDDNFFQSLSDFYAKNPVVTPAMPATNSRGQPFSDPDKERRYQEWLKKQGAR